MERTRPRNTHFYVVLALLFTFGLAGLVVLSAAVTAQGITPPSPYDTAPTPPPPPNFDRRWVDQGNELDHGSDFGLELGNMGCGSEPLSVTVGITSSNPLTGTYPISAAFESNNGYRYIRVRGGDDSDPTCLPLLTVKYWYTGSVASDYLYYWDNVGEQWKPVNRVGQNRAAYDRYLYTVLTSDTLPSLYELYAGMAFAWGHTTTVVIGGNGNYLPFVTKEHADQQ